MSVDETLVPAPRGGTYIRPFNAMEGKMPEADDDEDEDEEEEEDAPARSAIGIARRKKRAVGKRRPPARLQSRLYLRQLRRRRIEYVRTFDGEIRLEASREEVQPLFIYGPPGVGKTHLMYAITNNILLDNPNANITYIKGEDFTNKLVEAINKKQQEQFRNKYRKGGCAADRRRSVHRGQEFFAGGAFPHVQYPLRGA